MYKKQLLPILILLFFVLNSIITVHGQNLETIKINGKPCGPHGDAKAEREFNQNVFKNRWNPPPDNQIDGQISLEDLISNGVNEHSFSQNKAVTLEGYIFDIKPGGLETCNCHATKSIFKDTHIELTPSENETSPDKRVIIEVTPRIRMLKQQNGDDWTTGNLKSMYLNHFVRVTGWLFYDHSHEKQAFLSDPDDNKGDNWRATCWEVHPVTEIEDLGEAGTFTSLVENDMDNGEGTHVNYVPKKGGGAASVKSASIPVNSPLSMLIIIMLGAILGACGQGIRVIAGLKQVNDEAMKKNKQVKDILEGKQIAISLLIAFCIGSV
ncbi:MAG TPA: hypothetical protein VJY62_07980, partial [Bacteroidia bacterium]|nr:hypothetical protein [Bacteroidia bacterium]